MPISHTSRVAYQSLERNGQLQPMEAKIMRIFSRRPKAQLTRQQIANQSRLPLHCVCGRVNSLVKKGALVVHTEKVDQKTRRPREVLGLPALWSAA